MTMRLMKRPTGKEKMGNLKLSYQLNGRAQPTILRGAGFAQGSGRVQGYVFVDANGDGFFDADSRGYERIVASCRDGDMLACDFAFLTVDPGAVEVERVGQTCGERRALAVGGTCVETYGEVVE